MAALYTIAAVLAAGMLAFAALCVHVHRLARKKRSIRRSDCIIVLGARVWPDGRMSNTLIYRCVRALEIHRMYPGAVLILSGGQGRDEPRSEAQAMAEYMRNRGVPENSILLEDKSRSTAENLRFSMEIMANRGFETAIIVTSDYHAERALNMARDLGINACAAAAQSPAKLKSRIKRTVQEPISWIKYLLMRNKNTSR